MTHLREGVLIDLLTGRLEVAERQRALKHLRSGCSSCRQHLQDMAGLLLGEEPWRAAEPVAEDQYDEALSKAGVVAQNFRKRWRKEREKLERALTLLDRAPGGLGDESFPWRQSQVLHGWPLCEALLRKSYESRFTDPKRMLILAESAVGVAKHIKTEKYPWPGFVADIRARAFAELGNAYRINDRLSEADMAFELSIGFLEEGVGDPLLRARVLDLFSSLRSAQRRLDDSVELLEQVYRLYLQANDLHLAGRALISRGTSVHYQGRPKEAVGFFKRGLRLLDEDRDPRLVSIGRQALLDSLTECRQYRQASAFLFESGLREAFVAEPLNLLKLRWVEGKIHAGLGRSAKAERAFLEVRREYLRLEQGYEAALVGLELAAAWLRQGRPKQVRKLAEEIYETFVDLGVQSEAAKALYFLRAACL